MCYIILSLQFFQCFCSKKFYKGKYFQCKKNESFCTFLLMKFLNGHHNFVNIIFQFFCLKRESYLITKILRYGPFCRNWTVQFARHTFKRTFFFFAQVIQSEMSSYNRQSSCNSSTGSIGSNPPANVAGSAAFLANDRERQRTPEMELFRYIFILMTFSKILYNNFLKIYK